MSILVNVVNQKMYISSTMEGIVDGSQNFVKFRFNLSEDWDGLMTFAQFRQKGVAYNQYLDDENSVFLPSEIGSGTCTLMLYGSKDAIVGTTNYITLKIDKNILVSDASSTDISESLYNQLVSSVNSLNGDVTNLRSQINEIDFDGYLKNSGWEPNMYFSTDVNGNVVVKQIEVGSDTVHQIVDDYLSENPPSAGADGRGIASVRRTDGDGSPGTTDTYTITYTDDTTDFLTVYNGKDGKDCTGGNDGGGGVQPDWNQNDETAADYIKNRPFYTDGTNGTGHTLDEVFIPSTIARKNELSAVATSGSYKDLADAPSGLPTVTTEDDGKILRVSGGVWKAVAGTAVSQEGAASVGQVLKVAAVDENGKVTAVSAEDMEVLPGAEEEAF